MTLPYVTPDLAEFRHDRTIWPHRIWLVRWPEGDWYLETTNERGVMEECGGPWSDPECDGAEEAARHFLEPKCDARREAA